MWSTTTDTAGSIYASNSATASSPQFLSYINSATSYSNLTTIFGADAAAALVSSISSSIDSSASSIVPSTDSEVLAGYKAISAATTSILASEVGAIEMILNLASPGSIGIIVALQHPLRFVAIFCLLASNVSSIHVVKEGCTSILHRYLTHLSLILTISPIHRV